MIVNKEDRILVEVLVVRARDASGVTRYLLMEREKVLVEVEEVFAELHMEHVLVLIPRLFFFHLR